MDTHVVLPLFLSHAAERVAYAIISAYVNRKEHYLVLGHGQVRSAVAEEAQGAIGAAAHARSDACVRLNVWELDGTSAKASLPIIQKVVLSHPITNLLEGYIEGPLKMLLEQAQRRRIPSLA
jgi:hypothetical protein